MDLEEKKALLESSLVRAAEQLGDITPHVYARYYANCPEALESFNRHALGKLQQLEGEMVQQALYCLMEWYNSPGEIEIVLTSTIPHHVETLQVKFEYFAKLIDAVCETIAATIPAEERSERSVWTELQTTMRALCEENAKYIRMPPKRAAG